MEALPFSRLGYYSLDVFLFPPPREKNAQDVPMGSFHGPNLGVAHIISMSHSTGWTSVTQMHLPAGKASITFCLSRKKRKAWIQ